jgi:uncharacterized protein YbaP (TraB family)
MFFNIEGTGVYLLGSLHRGRTSFYPLPEPINQAFSAAHQIWFESPPLASAHPMSQCPPGTTIRDHLSLLVFWTLRLRLGNKFEGIKHLKPWALVIVFEAEAYNLEGCSAEFGVEPQLTKRAREENKPVNYLEHPGDGLAGFDSAPQQEQEEMLLRCLINFKAVREEVRDCITAWANADLGAWHKLAEKTVRKFPCFKHILYERNQTWAPKIREIVHSKKPAFVCIGSLHFGGEQSLQFLLKRDFGLEVRKISTARMRLT